MKRSKSILILEDDAIESLKIRRTLKNLGFTNEIVIQEDGSKGLEWLEEHRNALPGLIILDLNMPRLNGHEFLQIIKKDELLKLIPVVVFTTSGNLRDRLACYANNAAGYITKPLGFEKYEHALRVINQYWQTCELAY